MLRTEDTGHADSYLNWVICGASGYGLRDQRRDGSQLMEHDRHGNPTVVANSQLFIGRNWSGAAGRHAYSGLRIDIGSGRPFTIRLTPLVSCRDGKAWLDADPEPITLTA